MCKLFISGPTDPPVTDNSQANTTQGKCHTVLCLN